MVKFMLIYQETRKICKLGHAKK